MITKARLIQCRISPIWQNFAFLLEARTVRWLSDRRHRFVKVAREHCKDRPTFALKIQNNKNSQKMKFLTQKFTVSDLKTFFFFKLSIIISA
jgi:hypothetical protein